MSDDPLLDDLTNPGTPWHKKAYAVLRWLEGVRDTPNIVQSDYEFRYAHPAWPYVARLLDEYPLLPNQAPSAGSIVGAFTISDEQLRAELDHRGLWPTPTLPTTIYVLYSDMAMRHMGYYTDEGAARSDGTNHALDRYGRKQVGDWVRSPAPNVPAPMPTMPGEVRADGDSWWMPIYEGTPHGQGKIIDHYRVGPYKLFQGTAHGLEGFGGS